METNKKEQDIEKALLKRALGYDTEEIVEEYTFGENGEKTLNKRKVSQKHYSPDVSAIKILLEYFGGRSFDEIDRMTEQELIAERDRLLKELTKY